MDRREWLAAQGHESWSRVEPFVLKTKVPMGFCSLNEILQESKYKNVQQPGTVAHGWLLSSLFSQPAISPREGKRGIQAWRQAAQVQGPLSGHTPVGPVFL